MIDIVLYALVRSVRLRRGPAQLCAYLLDKQHKCVAVRRARAEHASAYVERPHVPNAYAPAAGRQTAPTPYAWPMN